jgi:hypothetical protein
MERQMAENVAADDECAALCEEELEETLAYDAAAIDVCPPAPWDNSLTSRYRPSRYFPQSEFSLPLLRHS